MIKFVIIFIISFFYMPALIAEGNYKLVTFFDLNSGTEIEIIKEKQLEHEFFSNGTKKFVRIFDNTAKEIDKRAHFYKEKINLNLNFNNKKNCQSNQTYKIFAIKDKNIISNILNNFLNGEIDQIQLNKKLSQLIEIKNEENYYALDFVLKDYYRDLSNGFLLFDLNECISGMNPKLNSNYFDSWFTKLNNETIKKKILEYYYKKQILKINNISYDFDQLILNGMVYNSKSEFSPLVLSTVSDRNFFITNLTSSQFQQLKSEGIISLDFTWSNLIHYDGNIIVDENDNILEINSLKFERKTSKLVYFQMIILIIIIILILFVYFSKNFPIQIKSYNYYFYFFIVFFILLNSFNFFLQKYSYFFVSMATYSISIILFIFIFFILVFEHKLEND